MLKRPTRPLIVTAPPEPPPVRKLVNRYTGHVDGTVWSLLREPFKRAKATEALEALAGLDRASELLAQLLQERNELTGQPGAARRAHRHGVALDVLAGRYPDDLNAWTEIFTADRDLERAEARLVAADEARQVAEKRAVIAFNDSWPALLTFLAAQRVKPSVDPTALATLHYSLLWPGLRAGPGSVGMNTNPRNHFTQWWPLSWEPLDRQHHRQERVAWEDWAWTELAADRYLADLEGREIAFEQDWPVPDPSRFTLDGALAEHSPVVEVSAETVETYARSLDKNTGKGVHVGSAVDYSQPSTRLSTHPSRER
jgi:hypothetical protein